MSLLAITDAGVLYKDAVFAGEEVQNITRVIFRNVTDLEPETAIDLTQGVPTSNIVHSQPIERVGALDDNAVVMSTVLGYAIGDFEYNWYGVVAQKADLSEVLIAVVQTPVQTKTKTNGLITGNYSAKSIVWKTASIAQALNVTLSALPWQVPDNTFVTQAAYDLGMDNKLDKTAKAKSAITADNANKLGNKLPEYYAKQADVDEIQGILPAVSKAVFDALAEKRIRDSAGSGFAEVGKSQPYNKIASVNEGIWAAYSQANTIRMGRGHTDKTGSSRTDSPLVNANGVQHVVDRVGNSSESTYNNVIISLPPAPDGTKTYDSATGVVTQHASAAKAFAGLVSDGSSFVSANSGVVDSQGVGICTWTQNVTSYSEGARALKTGLTAGATYRFTASTNDDIKLRAYDSSFSLLKTQVGVLDVVAPADGVLYMYIGTEAIGSYTANNLSFAPVTEQVITSRQDFVFLESFHEKIVGKDGSGSRRFHPLGNSQYGASTWNGIALNRDYAQGYSAFGEWDTTTHGYSKSWDEMNTFERELAVKDHENNIYSDDGDLIQVKYRIRVIEGLGDEWNALEPRTLYASKGTPHWLKYSNDATKAIVQRASNISTVDWYDDAGTPNDRLFGGTARPEYDSSDLGIWQPTNGASDAHNDLCFAIPIALVQRRNSGAYHPSLNSNGCAAIVIQDGSTFGWDDWRYWHNTTATKPKSIADTFTYAMRTANAKGDIAAAVSGRPDDKFYDAIYASDVQDLRMSSRRVPLNELREMYKRKAIAGEMRGAESVPFSYFVQSTVASSSNNFVNFGAGEIPLQAKVGDVVYLKDAGGGSYTKTTIAEIASDLQWIRIPDNHNKATLTIVVFETKQQAHKQANPTWTDIIGDPANIAATFPNGVEGQWIPELLTSSVRLSRKYLSSNSTWRYLTQDDGITWSLVTSILDTAANTAYALNNAESVELLSYETKANFTQDDDNSEVLDLGEVYAVNTHNTNWGNTLMSSLIGKVGMNDGEHPYAVDLPLTQHAINPQGEITSVTSEYAPKHMAITLGFRNNTPAVKTLDYLSSQGGVAKLCFAYKEMTYKAGAFKPWGDNNKFSMVNNQSTETNLNGDTVLVGMASFLTNHFIVNE